MLPPANPGRHPARPGGYGHHKLLNYVIRSVVTLCLIIHLAACTAPQPDSGPSTSAQSAAAPELVLVGAAGFNFDHFALDLRDLGYNVSMNSGVKQTTDLVLVVIDGQDGPMVATRNALDALVGQKIPRIAIAVTGVDKQIDSEIESLELQETWELLASYGITPVDVHNVVRWPGTDIVPALQMHLRRALQNHEPIKPTLPQETYATTAFVANFEGVPMTDALSMLAEEGLIGEVLGEPQDGVVNDCNPLVNRQTPAPGTVLAAGGTVGLIVTPPDKVDPTMAGCLLPELTPEQFAGRLAEISAQPTQGP